jgi:hypothetical protein
LSQAQALALPIQNIARYSSKLLLLRKQEPNNSMYRSFLKVLVALLLVLLPTLHSFAQQPAALPLDENTHRITYSAVVPVTGASQANLLARAKMWASGVTTAAHPPLLTTEQGTDVVTVTGSQSLSHKAGMQTITVPLRFTATISVREDRYQYRLQEFVLVYTEALQQRAELPLIEAPAEGKGNKKYLAGVRTGFEQSVAAALAKLQETMNKPLAQTDKKEW